MPDRYQPLRDALAAGPVQLPEWCDCKVAVERGDATALQRFIYEYDEAIPERSKVFFARLRAVLDEARREERVRLDPEIVAALLEERNALLGMVKRVVEIADSDPFQTVGFTVEHVVDLRAALADGEAQS